MFGLTELEINNLTLKLVSKNSIEISITLS